MAVATAAGLGMSIIAGEHFFSTFLSSPWTTEKFADTEEEKAKVRKMYVYAAVCSVIAAATISYILGQLWPLLAAMALSILYIWVYERALEGRL